MEYHILTPAFNEESSIAQFIESVISQKRQPKSFIIINDGSTDNTAKKLSYYKNKYPLLQIITRNLSNNEKTKIEIKEIAAFNFGFITYKHVFETNDVIVKLDADLILPDDYFEKTISEFEQNENLGICGGYCMIIKNGVAIKEVDSLRIRGALKAYRLELLSQIFPLIERIGWDELDEVLAEYKGWLVKIIDSPVLHLRPTMNRYKNTKWFFNNGVSNYKRGYSLKIAILKTGLKIFNKPYFIEAIFFLLGFTYACFKGEEKYLSREQERFINACYLKIIKKRMIKKLT